MVDLVYVPDMIESNGKTVRENNMEIKHSLVIGDEVRFIEGEDFSERYCSEDPKQIQDAVARGTFFVASIDRDCDGTPLYTLTLEVITDLKEGECIYDYYCRKFNPNFKANEEAFIEASNYASGQLINGIAEYSIEKV